MMVTVTSLKIKRIRACAWACISLGQVSWWWDLKDLRGETGALSTVDHSGSIAPFKGQNQRRSSKLKTSAKDFTRRSEKRCQRSQTVTSLGVFWVESIWLTAWHWKNTKTLCQMCSGKKRSPSTCSCVATRSSSTCHWKCQASLTSTKFPKKWCLEWSRFYKKALILSGHRNSTALW